MSFDWRHLTGSGVHSFNMTPGIDIVCQLIIFFLLVCQFIEAENFEISITDNCKYAENTAEDKQLITTVTVMKTPQERVDFAIGSEKIRFNSSADIPAGIAQLVDKGLANLPDDKRVVVLRIDRDVCFRDAQFALAGIAESGASNIRLAVLREKYSQ
jgi:biopolymer transport protein ExbD